MATKIRIPDTPFSEQKVVIGDNLLTVILKFNSRNNSWYLDIKDAVGENNIISGIKIMPNQNLTGRYVIDEFSNGNLWCQRNVNTDTVLGRDNFGINKDYGLIYLSNDEEEILGINGFIQL